MSERTCDVAIVGAGVIGTAIAWNLAKRGCTDVIVVDKRETPGLGSTAKAAGGIRAQFASRINVELSAISLPVFENFAKETGVDVVFNQAGYLWVTNRREDLSDFEQNVAQQRSFGLDVKLLSPAEIGRIAPYLKLDDLVGGTFHQRDGYASPADIVMGYHKASKERGVAYLLETAVSGIERDGDRVTALVTPAGRIRPARLVVAAGAWSSKVGGLMGVDIPIEPVRRQCLVTNPIPDGLPHPIPMTIDYPTGVYLHSESGGVLIGLADKNEPSSWNEAADPDFVEKMAFLAMERVPLLENATILSSWGGLYEVTPDHHPIIGPLPGLSNVTLAAGFSGHGVMHAPATGRLVAEWLLDGKPSLDLSCLRFGRFAEGALIHESHVI